MRTKKSHVNISKPFQSLDEIVRATGRSWRTVRKRLAEARCYPLRPDLTRADVLILMEDGPEPTYTAEEIIEIGKRCDRLLAAELAREAQAKRASKRKGPTS